MRCAQLLARSAPWAIGLLLAITLFCDALGKGGRWPLYDAIAMADRWGTPFFGYSQGVADGFLPSTPYFPGVSFVAIAARFLTPEYDVMLLQALGALSIPVLLAALAGVYHRLGGRLSSGSFVAVASTISLLALPEWLRYSSELKPDTLALTAFVGAWLAINHTAAARHWMWYGFAGMCVALALVLKQQAALLVLGLAIGMALRDLRAARIGHGWLSVAMGAIVGMAIVLNVSGAWKFAVLAHMGRPMLWEFQWGQLQFLASGIVILGLVLAARRSSRFSDATHPGVVVSLTPAALLWGLAGVIGALNLGGNIGNIQSGLLLTLPWLVLMLEWLPQRFLYTSWVIAAALMLGYMSLGDWQIRAESRRAVEAQTRAIVQSMMAPVVLASGSSYIALRSLPGVTVHEIDTWAHYRHGRLRKEVPSNSTELMRTLDADIIVCLEGCALQARLYDMIPSRLGYQSATAISPVLRDKVFIRPQFKSLQPSPEAHPPWL